MLRITHFDMWFGGILSGVAYLSFTAEVVIALLCMAVSFFELTQRIVTTEFPIDNWTTRDCCHAPSGMPIGIRLQ